MVGFKTFWLLLTLLLFAACVPQTKQTQCQSNEAFNATLRTCVPVVPGEDSFLSIDSPIPSLPITKYKSDSISTTFSVSISNPYAKPYTVKWERSYNGVVSFIPPSTPTSFTFSPSLYATEVGTHFITVKVLNASNAVVDSHTFQLNISENPKPVIQGSVTPAPFPSVPLSPLNLPQIFKFTISNNGAALTGAGYRTDWKLYRSGFLIDQESDSFTDTTGAGLNYPEYTFNPAIIDGISIGSYLVTATITNLGGEYVAEQQWSVTVSHPPRSRIISRNIYSSGLGPSYDAKTTAYHNVPYLPAIPGVKNFVPVSGVATGDYCVEVFNEEGTYPADGKYVRVSYFIGATQIYSGETSPGDKKVCLSDASDAVKSNFIVFTNFSALLQQDQQLVARVTDVATNTEYTVGDLDPLYNSYPITWDFVVKPQNAAPKVTLGPMTTISCTTLFDPNTLQDCTVASDTPFTVNIKLPSNASSDDFYTLPANEANFNYSIKLLRGGVEQADQTCTKASPGADLNGDDGYDCTFTIKSYAGAGPINLNALGYEIHATISDTGSPIVPGVPATSSTLKWIFKANGVSETNTAPQITAWTVSPTAKEGVLDGLNFSVSVKDAERDNHTYTIKYCPDGPCLNPVPLKSGSINRTNDTETVSKTISYTLPEDFLLNLTSLPCHTLKHGQSCAVNFFITVSDVPDTAVPIPVTSPIAISSIENYNPRPVLDTAFSTPNPASFITTPFYAFVGNPISISNFPASILTDASAIMAEKTFRYQWYVMNHTSAPFATAIDGATGPNLVWTPSHLKEANLATDNKIKFFLCVEDLPVAALPTPNFNDGSVCNDGNPWEVTLLNNLATVHDLSAAPALTKLDAVGNETAVWYEPPTTFNSVTSSAVYTAMFAADKKVYVKKSLLVDLGGIDNIDPDLITAFDALPGGNVDTIKNLSITGSVADGSLFVAYLASEIGSPASFYPQVRRIDIGAGKLAPNKHAGRFGFDYDGLGVVNSCNPLGACTPSQNGLGETQISISGSGFPITGAIVLQTPNGDFSINFGVANNTDTVCTNCSDAQIATEIKNLINSSTDYRLAGYSASRVGSLVTITGAVAGDYFDAKTSGAPLIAGQMGDIYISGGNWYVPFINKSLGGAYIDKLSAYYGPAAGKIVAVSILEPGTSAGLAAIEAATQISTYFEPTSNKLWVATVKSSGSTGKLYKVDPAFASATAGDIFVGQTLLKVQVSASASHVFVGATQVAGSEYKLGVYDSALVKEDEFLMEDGDNADTENIFNTASVSSYKIVPYGPEARIFAVSKAQTASTYKMYLARLRTTAPGSWTLSCGDCQTVSQLGQNLSGLVNIGVAPIRVKTGAAYRLSSSASVLNQGIKDVAFVAFGQLNSLAPATCNPGLGVFNIEGEAINSTSIFIGANPNEDGGLYRPPFVKN